MAMRRCHVRQKRISALRRCGVATCVKTHFCVAALPRASKRISATHCVEDTLPFFCVLKYYVSDFQNSFA
jgi:hypothetical protein